MKISIIIPVYNTEKYLERCVNSIIEQIESECEIILINDGSTDGSEKLCNQLTSLYPKYISVIHKKNEGLSIARNTGIEYAKGKYILCVDSDDTLNKNLLKILLEEIKTNIDIYEFGYRVYINNKENYVRMPYISSSTNANEYLYNSLKNYSYGWYAWKCLIKKELYKKNNLFYPANKKYEDVFLIPRLYSAAKTIKGLKIVGYNYFLGRPGAITAEINYKTEIDKLYVINENIKYFNKTGYSKLNKLLCDNFAKMYCSALISLYYIKNKKERQDLYKELKEKKQIVSFILNGPQIIVKKILLILGVKLTAKLLYIRGVFKNAKNKI